MGGASACFLLCALAGRLVCFFAVMMRPKWHPLVVTTVTASGGCHFGVVFALLLFFLLFFLPLVALAVFLGVGWVFMLSGIAGALPFDCFCLLYFGTFLAFIDLVIFLPTPRPIFLPFFSFLCTRSLTCIRFVGCPHLVIFVFSLPY